MMVWELTHQLTSAINVGESRLHLRFLHHWSAILSEGMTTINQQFCVSAHDVVGFQSISKVYHLLFVIQRVRVAFVHPATLVDLVFCPTVAKSILRVVFLSDVIKNISDYG